MNIESILVFFKKTYDIERPDIVIRYFGKMGFGSDEIRADHVFIEIKFLKTEKIKMWRKFNNFIEDFYKHIVCDLEGVRFISREMSSFGRPGLCTFNIKDNSFEEKFQFHLYFTRLDIKKEEFIWGIKN